MQIICCRSVEAKRWGRRESRLTYRSDRHEVVIELQSAEPDISDAYECPQSNNNHDQREKGERFGVLGGHCVGGNLKEGHVKGWCLGTGSSREQKRGILGCCFSDRGDTVLVSI